MQRVFFHIHIWKTGGTSFFNICSENFGKSFRRDVMLIQNWFLSIEQLQWLLNYHDWLRCYSCHMLSGNLPYGHDGKEIVGIAFVRDPVSRFISSYNFQSQQTYRGGVARQYDLDDFIGKALVDEDNPWWRNGQTFILGGSRTTEGLAVVADRVKKGQMLLLPMERFDECCLLLERLFPDDFKECSYTRLNVSRQRQPVSDQQRAAVGVHMDLDLKLLEMANEYMDTTLAKVFPDKNQLLKTVDDFQNRCHKKKQRNRLAYLVKNFKGSVKTGLSRLAGRGQG